MRLGIMQPYFFPYLGYFELISRVDRWVVFDTAQYIRHGWVNRNRILHPSSGWQYVVVPLEKHGRDTPIREIRVHREQPWKERIVGQLQHYRRRAPHFRQTVSLVESVLAPECESLAALNVRALDAVCGHLGIRFEYHWFSRMNLELRPIEAPGDWALEIATALKASEYLNLPGGADLFDRAEFARRGIELTILEPRQTSYAVDPYSFEPNLSVVDVLMWNSPAEVRSMLSGTPAAA
jgi:hypothetical protein